MVSQQKLSILSLQTDIIWMSPNANTSEIEEIIADVESDFDICVLPEMFTTGFGNESLAYAETMNLHSHKWMKMIAAQRDCLIMGSLPMKENGKCFNRCLLVFPDQSTLFYDKVHLFSLADENQKFSAGNKKLQFNFKGWELFVNICYDLRFPKFCANHSEKPFDLMINMANWPAKRFFAYDSLLCARAIENQGFVLGVNRTGSDGKGIQYKPLPHAYDFLGNQIIGHAISDRATIYTFDKQELLHFRTQFNTLKDIVDNWE